MLHAFFAVREREREREFERENQENIFWAYKRFVLGANLCSFTSAVARNSPTYLFEKELFVSFYLFKTYLKMSI